MKTKIKVIAPEEEERAELFVHKEDREIKKSRQVSGAGAVSPGNSYVSEGKRHMPAFCERGSVH